MKYPTPAEIAIFSDIFLAITLVTWMVTGLFLLSYIFVFNWRKNGSGRALVYFVGSLNALLLLVVLARWLGDYAYRYPLTLLVYLGLAFTAVRLFIQLWSTNHKAASPDTPARRFDDTVPRR